MIAIVSPMSSFTGLFAKYRSLSLARLRFFNHHLNPFAFLTSPTILEFIMDPHIYLLIRDLAIVLGSLATAHPALPQSPPQEPSKTLKVGFGIADITPRRPTPMAGYYGVRYSTATHDPLWAKATVFDDGSTRVAIISVDLISTNPWMVRETRKRIEEKLQIPPSHVMISATHSHTGPMLYEPDEQLMERFGNQSDEAKQYMVGLPERIAQSVFDAAASLKPRSVAYAVGEERQLAFNRRFFMKDGTVGWNPGKLNPNIVREAGSTYPVKPNT